MRHSAPLALLLLACACAPAFADECSHSAPRGLDLDLAGAKSVMFLVGPHRLRVAAAPAAAGTVSGRACASVADSLDGLGLSQERAGDRLVVRLRREGSSNLLSFGKRYAYLDLQAQVPDDLLVHLSIGSGDAWVTGAGAASADVGSGDAQLRGTRGRVTAKVGSGDIRVDGAGALHVLSIGSGDVEAGGIRGDTEVGSIGSGDFGLERASGSVKIGSIGSGDATLSEISGDVRVGSVGSGDLEVRGVGGDLTVSSLGHGDVDHRDVRGRVEIPRKR